MYNDPVQTDNDGGDRVVSYNVKNSRGPESKAYKTMSKAMSDIDIDMPTLAGYFVFDAGGRTQQRFFDFFMQFVRGLADIADTNATTTKDPAFNAQQYSLAIYEMMRDRGYEFETKE